MRAKIAAACAAAGRAPEQVRLLAVSKGQPASALRELYALGVRSFGESYAQELAAKAPTLADLPDLRFEFIGRIQSNKLAVIIRHARALQSLGSERHARLLARQVREAGLASYPVHLLVNAGGEATKDGLAVPAVEPLARLIAAEMPELHIKGVMAIPPPLADDQNVGKPPELYLRLRALADVVGDGELSLGMSDDLAVAIAAGSDCVRIGTALMGPRA